MAGAKQIFLSPATLGVELLKWTAMNEYIEESGGSRFSAVSVIHPFR